ASKAFRRLERKNYQKNMDWLRENAESYESYLSELDKDLWREAQEVEDEIDRKAKERLSSLPFELGGGGATSLLYFFARFLKPKVVVETGVAAGFSSQGFLMALRKNGFGKLYSSDFPYFRIAEPEKYIGYVVDDDLKANWVLRVDGDRKNIEEFSAAIEHIDLVHYDSDKSYAGRRWVMDRLGALLGPSSVVLMDDIQDNAFFMDYVSDLRRDTWKVFHYRGKFVGLVGNFTR